MLNFDYILTTQPHTIRAVFVSDLHLSAHTPELITAFVRFINDLSTLQNLNHFFILGDFVDAWAGDDEFFKTPNHWLIPIIEVLKKLKTPNRYFMHGNRDFMIGKKLCHTASVKLISEPYFFEFQQKLYRLEHGDRLCTDDKSYQKYRTIIRNPIIKTGLSALPLATRQKIAGTIKKQSHTNKTKKSTNIMDTNELAIHSALQGCDALIHGHTHRPSIHYHKDKKRIVLGDWRLQHNEVVGEVGILFDDNELIICQIKNKI